jgi:hypothetical protein
VLGQLAALWRVKVDLKQYGPALAIRSASKVSAMAAFQAEVSRAVGQEMQTLGQQRDASSTTGARSGDRPRRGQNCFDCGSPDHYRRDPSCPGRSSSNGSTNGSTTRMPSHGLERDEAIRINAICNAKVAEFSTPHIIPDGLEIKEGSNVVATFCNQCVRFLKGKTMHSGATHTGRSFARSTAPAPAPAANLGTTAPLATAPRQVGFAQLASTNVCPPCAPAPAPHVPVSIAAPLIRSHTPAYDFGSMNSISQAQTTMYESDSDDEDGFLGLLIGDMLKG